MKSIEQQDKPIFVFLLFNAKGTIFQLYHCKNKLHFDDMMISTLY